MFKALKVSIAVLFLMLIAASVGLPVQNRTVVVGSIKDKSLVGGCGCNFQTTLDHERRNRKYVFSADLERSAWMNINGRDVQFKRARTISAPEDQRKAKRGEHTVLEYKSGELTLTIAQTITTPCPEGDESCEWVGMSADITLSEGKRTKRIKAVGGCGC